jgi:hypothetical protein
MAGEAGASRDPRRFDRRATDPRFGAASLNI